MELFDQREPSKEPLAARMRPRTLDEYIGQEHIVGKGRLLRRAIAADQLTSVIFYGPPGTGKTTLARVIANHTKSSFITLNAVLTGVQHIREAIAQAEQQYKLYNRRTILFVDEVHRWNKSQQDALLPWVENGTIILVGATTENPFFEVNRALVSRSRVFQLKALTVQDLRQAAEAALADAERGYGRYKVEFEQGALEHLIETANGDARSLLNALELAVETTPEHWPPADGERIYISRETAEESIQKKVVLYDRDGDYHYDIISAFIKSLRGRDPDAAMYWLARMVAAGEDPGFIFRRMLISACEDTGLADPFAITVVESAAAAFDRVGLPEGRYHLAHAALYLATAPKSNSSMAFFDALSSVEKEDAEVPNHLRDPSRDAEGFGHGSGYMYPHAYTDHWVAQQYLPDALVGRVFYTPSDQGYEKTIRDDVLSRRELQIAALLEEDSGAQADPAWWQMHGRKERLVKQEEQLTFTPKNAAAEAALSAAEKDWRRRLDSNRAAVLLELRRELIEAAQLRRHHRSLVWNADDGLLIWEVLRREPEGFTCGMCRTAYGRKVLEQYGSTLGGIDRPELAVADPPAETGMFAIPHGIFGGAVFDRLFFRDCCADAGAFARFAASLTAAAPLLAAGWRCVMAQKVPGAGQRLAPLIRSQVLRGREKEYGALLTDMEQAEEAFFSDAANPLFAWDAQSAAALLGQTFSVSHTQKEFSEKRRITEADVRRWFDGERSAYGSALAAALGKDGAEAAQRLLETACERRIFLWKTVYSFYSLSSL